MYLIISFPFHIIKVTEGLCSINTRNGKNSQKDFSVCRKPGTVSVQKKSKKCKFT